MWSDWKKNVPRDSTSLGNARVSTRAGRVYCAVFEIVVRKNCLATFLLNVDIFEDYCYPNTQTRHDGAVSILEFYWETNVCPANRFFG